MYEVFFLNYVRAPSKSKLLQQILNFFSLTPSTVSPSLCLSHCLSPYLSFLVGVRQINVNAGFTYHTVASTTLQGIEWKQTASPFNTGSKHSTTTTEQNTCTYCI